MNAEWLIFGRKGYSLPSNAGCGTDCTRLLLYLSQVTSLRRSRDFGLKGERRCSCKGMITRREASHGLFPEYGGGWGGGCVDYILVKFYIFL